MCITAAGKGEHSPALDILTWEIKAYRWTVLSAVKLEMIQRWWLRSARVATLQVNGMDSGRTRGSEVKRINGDLCGLLRCFQKADLGEQRTNPCLPWRRSTRLHGKR